MRSRLIAVVASAGLVLAGLSGCRLEVGAAAYVGSITVSQKQVDTAVASIKADGKSSLAAYVDANRVQVRRAVMEDLLFLTVAKRYAAEKGYPAPSADYQAASQQYQLPTTNSFLHTAAEAEAYRQMLLQQTAPAAPSDGELRQVYQLLVAQGYAGNSSFEQIKPQLLQDAGVQRGIALREQLTAALGRYRVQVNPVYGATVYPLWLVSDNNGQQVELVTLPLGDPAASPAVVDLPQQQPKL